MKHISQGTYFESCILAFFFPRKLQWWHPFTKSLSAWFKLISSTKTAIIVLFGCCLYPLCVCILLVFISNLLGAIQWHRIMTFPAPNYKQMISNKQNYRASDTNQPTLELWLGIQRIKLWLVRLSGPWVFYMIHQKKLVFWQEHIRFTFLWGW